MIVDGLIRQRARRGGLELDLLLKRYLDQALSGMGQDQRQILLALLSVSDRDLLLYLQGDELPEELNQRDMVLEIRHFLVSINGAFK